MLVALLGMAALTLDVGRAYYAKRSLQSSADAAALAGAMELPDAAAAAGTAREYGASATGKNQKDNIPNVTTSATTKCVPMAPCKPVNALTVTESTELPTIFAKVLGIDTFHISATSTACSPCTSRPLDIMLVLDRTGSMCQTSSGASDPSCTDLNNARNGMKTFLGYMDPDQDWVGLAVFPPARSTSSRCNTPDEDDYDRRSAKYVIVPLSDDYKTSSGSLNTSSNLVSTINCQKGNGSTAYAHALEAAQAELDAHGRDDAQDVIVFLSDGAANTGPDFAPSSYRQRPCAQGVSSAAAIKSGGTVIYSIGYDLDALGGGANRCRSSNGNPESPSITAYAALQSIATDSTTFYNQPDPGQLNTIFTTIAAQVSGSILIE